MQIAATRLRGARIGLTSLVDVVFILLFFFMLASNELKWRGTTLDLASQTGSVASAKFEAREMTVLLMPEGTLRHAGALIQRQNLLKMGAQMRITIIPMPGTSMQVLVDLLDELQASAAEVLLGNLESVQ